MEARLQKWGNSMGIRIPSSILKTLNLKVNDVLEIVEDDNKIIITVRKNKKISLSERFEKYKGKNEVTSYDWGKPVGKEIW